MSLYAESSAVLAWLLGEPRAGKIIESLGSADLVMASDLTLVECDRVLIRAAHLGELTEADSAARRAELQASAAHWTILRLSADIIDRARQRFPSEPVRTLDALHLAAAIAAKAAASDLAVLSLDDRIRTNARALGFAVVPADDATATSVTPALPNQ